MARRPAAIATLLAGLVACGDAIQPRATEAWTADLVVTRQVLFMTLTRESSTVKGTGSLTALLVPGSGDPLTIAGTRRGDTLDITYRRADGGSFRFVGSYVANNAGLQGSVNGGEFTNLRVSFRKR
ncbi:MAG: hypothetical protein IPP90_06110 [Gemmatimonadaceae bacterium]|nr:hypothetical protein [Gemmatimonadaceae bacterium]